MRALLTTIVVLLAAGLCQAQDGAPRFEDHPVRGTFTGRPHPVVLATPDARAFRTRLREAAKEKPNFAGSYVIAIWGCGTECVSGAALDLRTGRAVMFPFTLCCWGADVPDDFEPVEFRLDSSLLKLHGLRNEDEHDATTHYYTVENGRLRELKPGAK